MQEVYRSSQGYTATLKIVKYNVSRIFERIMDKLLKQFQLNFSTSKKIIFASIILYLGVISFVVYSSISEKNEIFSHDIDEHLLFGAMQLSKIIPENLHNRHYFNRQQQTADYHEYQKPIGELARLFNLSHIYSLTPRNGNFVITSTNLPDSSANKSRVPMTLYDFYGDITELLQEALRQNVPVFLDHAGYAGAARSVFIPQSSTDGSRFLLAASVEQSKIPAVDDSLVQTIILFLIPLVVFLIGFNRLTSTHTNYLKHKVEQRTMELRKAYTTNKLTGLYNRSELICRIKDKKSTLALFDIDSFKEINDLYGSEFGDKLLVQVSDRFKALVDDNVLLFKTHADEFAMVSQEADQTGSFIELTRKLLAAVKDIDFCIDEQVISITATAGIACQSETSIVDADLALKYAKKEYIDFYIYSDSHPPGHKYHRFHYSPRGGYRRESPARWMPDHGLCAHRQGCQAQAYDC